MSFWLPLMRTCGAAGEPDSANPHFTERGYSQYLSGAAADPQLGQLDVRLGALFADAVQALMQKEHLRPQDVVAIGCHGQTVWHEPIGDAPHTLQIGDNNQIVAKTGVTVVGDFRRRDIALGGQGAPLVPAFHQALLAHPSERRMVLNDWWDRQSVDAYSGAAGPGLRYRPGQYVNGCLDLRQCGQPYDKNAARVRVR